MSTDQVVSRYPQDWVEAASVALFEHDRSQTNDPDWPELDPGDQDSYRDAIAAVLAALEEVRALAPAEIEYGAAKFYDNGNYALMEVYQDRSDAQELVDVGLDRYPSSRVLQRHVAGPWVEVPDATS